MRSTDANGRTLCGGHTLDSDSNARFADRNYCHVRFLPGLFSARTAPVLWTFERGSTRRVTRPVYGKPGLQSSAIVAAKPKKLERLMPSSVARLSIRTTVEH